MTGPEHFALAEELLGKVRSSWDGEYGESPYDFAQIAAAQAHATLALAASQLRSLTAEQAP